MKKIPMIKRSGYKRFTTVIFAFACNLSFADAALDKALNVQSYAPPLETPSQVLIRNATLWTMEKDGIIEGVDLLLQNGKIKAYGKNLKPSRGALVMDATGMHVTPGIIDAHSHSAVEDTGVNEGVPSVSSQVRIEDILVPDASEIYQQLAGGVTTIHVLHGSANAIGGQNALLKLRWGAETPDQLLFDNAPKTIKFALGENPKQSGFAGPGREPRYPKTRMGVAAIIRDSFKKAEQYRDELKRYENLSSRQQAKEVPPGRNLQLEALVEVLEGERTIHAHAYRADEILMLMRLGDELGFTVGTFQHVLEGYQVADEMVKHGANGSTFSDWWSYKIEAFEAIPYNAAIMKERGVLTSLNSDDSNLARRLNLEAAKVIRYGGMTPIEAMEMVTINSAKQLNIGDRVGSLKKGKDADVVIWSGNPLSVFSRVESTFVDGKLLFNREIDQGHRAKVTKARAALIAEIGGESKDEAKDKAELVVNPNDAGIKYKYAPLDAPDKPVAIIGATVHPIDAPAIENGIVIFDQGKIISVGGSDLNIPASAERIDATGKHLWPGIIHTNTVLGISEIDSVAGTVDIAEAGDINADIDVSLAIDANSAHFPVARSGGITHAVVVPAGGMVAGTTALVRTDGWSWEEMAGVRSHSLVLRWPDPIPARYAVFMGGQKSLADRIKQSEEQLEELDKLLDSARAYGKALADSNKKPMFDQQLEALLPVINGKRPLWVSAREKFAIIAAVEWAQKQGLRIVLTGARDAYLVADFLAEHQVPVILSNIVGEPPRADDPFDTLYAMPAKLEKAGVLFSIASGTRTGGSANARYITLFAGIASGYGLDKEAAYRSITLNPAKILGVDDVLGSITAGKSASLVLTDGDLLEPSTNIEQVWIDGNQSSMDDIQKLAYKKWKARPAR
jgi:imidazolonepropionase-like amidohydrolase